MKNMKKLVTIPLAAFAVYGITACTQIQPCSVESGKGHKCETEIKERRTVNYLDDGLEPYVSMGVAEYLKKHDTQFVIIHKRDR